MERLALVVLFVKSDGANHSCCSFVKNDGANHSCRSFCKERRSDSLTSLFLKEWQNQMSSFTIQRAMKSDSFFCFGHKKGEKHGEKNKFEEKHSYIKRANQFFIKSKLFPLKDNILYRRSLQKELQEQISPSFFICPLLCSLSLQFPNLPPQAEEMTRPTLLEQAL